MRTEKLGQQGRLALAAVAAAVLLGGCGAAPGEDDEIEELSQDLTGYTRVKDVDVGFGIKRKVFEVASQKCVAYRITHPKPGYSARVCTKLAPDWMLPVSVELFTDAAALASGTVFPAYRHSGWTYQGCGPQAALNVLNYFGRGLTIGTCAGAVHTYHFVGGSIASTPDDLADGLRTLLQLADGRFVVNRITSHAGEFRHLVRSQLRKGNPVVILSRSGGHYQVVTGLNANRYHVIDYGGQNKWLQEDEIGLDFGFFPAWGSILTGGVDGYDEYTMITVERAPK